MIQIDGPLEDVGHEEFAQALEARADWEENRDPDLSAMLREAASRVRELEENG